MRVRDRKGDVPMEAKASVSVCKRERVNDATPLSLKMEKGI